MIVRLIRSGPRHPFFNMALDEAIDPSTPALRLYTFSPPGLTLGYFQSHADFTPAWLASSGLVAVRRATGGAAIAHKDDLTFAFVAKPDMAWFHGDVKESYERLHRALARGLAQLGVAAAPRADDVITSDSGRPRDAVCFYSATSFDLVAAGKKLVGSAQRRTRDRVLHHGSIPISKNVLAPDAAFLTDLIGRTPTVCEVEDAVIAGCAAELGCEFRNDEPTASELDRANELVRTKYGTAEWNGGLAGKAAKGKP